MTSDLPATLESLTTAIKKVFDDCEKLLAIKDQTIALQQRQIQQQGKTIKDFQEKEKTR